MSSPTSSSILKGDMMRGCLQLLATGHNPGAFPYVNPPAPADFAKALEMLGQLGLLEPEGKLSDRGKKVESFGVDVQTGVALVNGVKYECSDELITILAMVEAVGSGDVFLDPGSDANLRKKISDAQAEFKYPGSDHLTLFNMYMAWSQARADERADKWIFDRHLRVEVFNSADAGRKRLLQAMRDSAIATSGVFHNEISSMHGKNRKDYFLNLVRCMAAGNFLRVAKRNPATGKYETVPRGIQVGLSSNVNHDPQATSKNEWVFFSAFHDEPTDGHRKTIRVVTAIAPEFLFHAAPDYWSDGDSCRLDTFKMALSKPSCE